MDAVKGEATQVSAGEARRRSGRRGVARALTVGGGAVALGALGLSLAQFYRVSSARLGPGALMVAMPKIVATALAPEVGVAGAVGAGCALAGHGLAGLGPEHRRRTGLATRLAVGMGAAAAGLSALYVRDVLAVRADFAQAFGPGWEAQMPAQAQEKMLKRRWVWRLPVAAGARVERDVVFAEAAGAEPGQGRKLLADVWSPPEGVAQSGIGFIYLHGGGYSAFDKGGPTEPWFRHLAAQGHVVMDVAYRMIPEVAVPGMQGDVKRAIAWLKRNAGRCGVDPARVVIGGGSAGSHLALLAAYAPYHPLFTPAEVCGEDLRVAGVIGFYNAGDYRLERRVVVKKRAWERWAERRLTRVLARWAGSEIAVDEQGGWDARLLLGGEPEQWPELYRQISPIVHVGPGAPPTLQFVGGHDLYVGESGAGPTLHRRLVEVGVRSVYVEYPRTDHAFDLFWPRFAPAAQAAMYEVDRFLAAIVGNVRGTFPTIAATAETEAADARGMV